MRESGVIVVTVFSMFALVLIGSGLTGQVTSQTCCHGESCEPAYQCDELRTPEQEERADASVLIGGLVLFVALVVYIALQLSHR